MKNEYGLDTDYFAKWLKRVQRDIQRYTPAEFAREMARMSRTADSSVLSEKEFATTIIEKNSAPIAINM